MAAGEPRTKVTLPSDREIVLTRVFDAPRPVVFDAWTKPEYLVRWWGPGGFTLPLCEIDLRPGGRYRFVLKSPDGSEFPVTGTYLDVVRPKRLVYTDRFDMEGLPAFEGRVTVAFVERNGRTTVTLTARYETPEHRDTVLRMQMAEGFAGAFERLDLVLARGVGVGPGSAVTADGTGETRPLHPEPEEGP